MATGEGKTLLLLYRCTLMHCREKVCMLLQLTITLPRRDSEWMGMLFEFHGLKVDCIDNHEPNSDERRNAYLS